MKPKLLLVDDQSEIREALIGRLGGQSIFNIVEACCGEEAINILDGENFDLIISDLCMSPIDGLSLFAHLKKHERNIPFILFSGSELNLPPMEPPFVGYVKKPDFSGVIQLIIGQVMYEASHFGT